MTAAKLPASRLKKYTPGLPSTRTYVRTFTSGNVETRGNAGTIRGRTFVMWKGTTATKACRSNRSSSNPFGTRSRNAFESTGQCANSKSCHVCVITHGLSGVGHGRCAVSTRLSWLNPVAMPSRCVSQRIEKRRVIRLSGGDCLRRSGHLDVIRAARCFHHRRAHAEVGFVVVLG